MFGQVRASRLKISPNPAFRRVNVLHHANRYRSSLHGSRGDRCALSDTKPDLDKKMEELAALFFEVFALYNAGSGRKPNRSQNAVELRLVEVPESDDDFAEEA